MYQESSRNFETNKILGGVGALLTAVGSFVPFTGPIGIVSIVGIILLLISLKGLSEEFKEPAIWRNSLNGFIFGIVAIIAAIVVAFIFIAAVFSFRTFTPLSVGFGAFAVLVGIVGFIIMFVFYILFATYFRRAFDIIEQKTGERMFHTGGLLLLIGAVLTIILVGFVLLFVAWILLAVAFFSMRPPTQPAPAYSTPYNGPSTSMPPSGQSKYCPYCGAENKLEATFCTRCGRRLS